MKLPLAFRSILGCALVVAIFLALPPHAAPSLLDLRTVLVHTVLVAIVGMGMTLVIASGGIDLSVGSAAALCGVIAALTSRAGFSVPIIILSSLATGAACGLYNGVLIAGLRLPAFIVTLGTLGFFRGLAKWVSAGRTISAPTHGLDLLMQPVPSQPAWLVAPGVWIMLATGASIAGLMHHTVLGRHLLAIGGNETAATYAGVPVLRRRLAAYTACGTLVGLAAVLQFGRLTVGDPTVNMGLELEAVAAVVIGGASLSGGTGSVIGTVVGSFMMAYLRNRCVALGWPTFVQEMIVGHIIIAAVGLDLWRRRRHA